jgi:hypothetical protein
MTVHMTIYYTLSSLRFMRIVPPRGNDGGEWNGEDEPYTAY